MKRFNQLKELVDALEGDFEKFYDKGNNAAGTRVRKGMQEMKNMAQEIRIEVQSQKNSQVIALSTSIKKGSVHSDPFFMPQKKDKKHKVPFNNISKNIKIDLL